MLVTVLVQAIQQALTVRRQQAVAVQQHRGGLQRGVLAAAEDLVEVEAQQPVVRPLAALDEQDAAEREQQQPARRVVLAEDAARDDVVPGLAQERLRRRRLTVELQPVRLERERVFPFRLRVVGAEREQRGGTGLAAHGAEHGQLVAIVERLIGGCPIVAQHREKLPEPLALQVQSPFGAPLALEVAAEPNVVARQGAQRRVRRPTAVSLRGFAPAIHRRPDIAAENLGQIMVAVKLILVVDAGKGGGSRRRSGGHDDQVRRLTTPTSRRNRISGSIQPPRVRRQFVRMLLLLAPSLVSGDIQVNVRVTLVIESRRSGHGSSAHLGVCDSQHRPPMEFSGRRSAPPPLP